MKKYQFYLNKGVTEKTNMAKRLNELKCNWAENVEMDSKALVEEKESEESKRSNDDSSVIKRPNDDHNDLNTSMEKQKVEKYDKGDMESDNGEEDVDFHSEEKGDESDWKEELHLREELINLALEEDAQSRTQTMEEVLQELSQDMRADSKWLFRISSRLAVGAVVMMRRSDQLKTLEIKKREESQLGPLLLESETLQATDASHDEKKQKPKKDPLKCFYCHEEGHFRRECPKRLNTKRDRSRGNWHQPRGGWNQTRGTSGYRGSQIRDREGYQNRRPYENRPRQPPYGCECNEQHRAEAHENLQRQSEFENEKASHNPLN